MKGVFFKNVRRYFKQYCNRTSVHGLQYFGEDRSVFERLWWIFFFVICLVVCGFCIFEIYNKWREGPVIVNFANSETPINEIPFPAVTICSEWKWDPDLVNTTKIVQKLIETNNLTSEEYRKLNVLRLMCERLKIPWNIDVPTEIEPEEFFKDLTELNLYLPLQLTDCDFPSVDEVWMCFLMFYSTVTEEGICYSFNMIPNDEIFRENIEYPRDPDRTSHISFMKYSNWSAQNGYDRKYENEEEEKVYKEYPHRAVAGVNNGFRFKIMSPPKTSDPGCRTPVRGYKMLVHTAITIPRFRQDFIRIPSDANVAVVVKPQVVKTSKKVQKYSPNRRKCYFETERRLKFFKIYTSSNCKLECLTNYTLFMCGCAAFYMPRENDTKICIPSRTQTDCQKEAEYYMTRVTALKLNPMTLDSTLFSDFKERHCNCLPTCSELFYEVEVTQSKWNWMDEYEDETLSNITVASVTVYFKSDTFVARERNELYGPLDFLSNFGGLIGLFTGFSILSLIEILYFLSVRIIFNRRLYGQWAGLEN